MDKKGADSSKIVKDGMMTFHKAGIESNQVVCFIPFNGISRVWVGVIRAPLLMLLIGFILLLTIVPAIYIQTSFISNSISILLFFPALIGFVLICKYGNDTTYALNIETAGSTFSFVASQDKYIDQAYRLIRDAMNKREDERGTGTYNFINGKFKGVSIGDGSTTIIDHNEEIF